MSEKIEITINGEKIEIPIDMVRKFKEHLGAEAREKAAARLRYGILEGLYGKKTVKLMFDSFISVINQFGSEMTKKVKELNGVDIEWLLK